MTDPCESCGVRKPDCRWRSPEDVTLCDACCEGLRQKKIGMCCFCGGTFNPQKTILLTNGTEVCQDCAERSGLVEIGE